MLLSDLPENEVLHNQNMSQMQLYKHTVGSGGLMQPPASLVAADAAAGGGGGVVVDDGSGGVVGVGHVHHQHQGHSGGQGSDETSGILSDSSGSTLDKPLHVGVIAASLYNYVFCFITDDWRPSLQHIDCTARCE